MVSGVLVTRFNIDCDWITPEASEYLYDRRGLHMRDVHIKPLVVRRPVSTLGSIRIHAQRASAPSQPLVVCKQYQELSEGLHDTEAQKACLLSAHDKLSLPMVLVCQP